MESLKWWQRAVFYQIYPRSFADGNGDGIGDFPGMTARLDYLHTLGVDALWLSPHYPSPFLDCGYDISDYTGVGPEYGTLADFTTFLHEAHTRDMRVILDLVLNHTSHQHPWFLDSSASRHSPKRDWYIWRNGKDGGPPNDWVSLFGGSAWELDEVTGQYYYHFFLKEQPDLNWRNPDVKSAMWDAVRFWLDLGVDGFRLDAIGTVFEDPELPHHDQPLKPAEFVHPASLPWDALRQVLRYQVHQPGLHSLMQELRVLVDEYPGDRVLVGEDDDIAFHGTGDNELHLVFNFPLMRVDRLTPEHVRMNQMVRLADLPTGAWPCNTLGNHDTSRMWSRYGDGHHDAELARLHLALLLTLKGTPFLYNGEEIGMTDLQLTELYQVRDTVSLGMYTMMIEQLGTLPEEAFGLVAETTRDRNRTPMQWSDAPNAGFCPEDTQPWLPINPNFSSGVNVAAQEDDSHSLLNFYRMLLRLRRATPALISGDYQALQPYSSDYLAFLRHDSRTGQTCLVLLNFVNGEQTLTFDANLGEPRLIFSSVDRGERPLALHWFTLAPFEICIVRLV
ncbi:MAG: alpha-amylase family glycosyl hydrolase [Chloroflexota bacterium]